MVETHLLDPGHGEGVHPRQGGEHLLTGQDEGALARGDPPRRAAPILTPLGTPPQLARAAGAPQEAALLQLAHHLRFVGQVQFDRQHVLGAADHGIALGYCAVIHAQAGPRL